MSKNICIIGSGKWYVYFNHYYFVYTCQTVSFIYKQYIYTKELSVFSGVTGNLKGF